MSQTRMNNKEVIETYWKRALVGGFVGALVFVLMGKFMAPHIIGEAMDVPAMIAETLGKPYIVGVAMHFFVNMVVFTTLYLLIGFQRIPGPAWLRGAIFLIPIYLIIMIVVMPLGGHGFFLNSAPKAMVALVGHVVAGICIGAIVGEPKKM